MKIGKNLSGFKLLDYDLESEEEQVLREFFNKYGIFFNHILRFSITYNFILLITQKPDCPIEIFAIKKTNLYHLETIDVYYKLEDLLNRIENLKSTEIFFSFVRIKFLENGQIHKKPLTSHKNTVRYLFLSDNLKLLQTNSAIYQNRSLKTNSILYHLSDFVTKNQEYSKYLQNFLQDIKIIPENFDIFERETNISEILKIVENSGHHSQFFFDKILALQLIEGRILISLRSDKQKIKDFSNIYLIRQNKYFKLKEDGTTKEFFPLKKEQVSEKSCLVSFASISRLCNFFNFSKSVSVSK